MVARLVTCFTRYRRSARLCLGLASRFYRSEPALCVARPLCRRPSVALAHEEARQPPPEKLDDSALAESSPSDLCLPKSLSGMTCSWTYGNEAADGRVYDPAAACYPVVVHATSAP